MRRRLCRNVSGTGTTVSANSNYGREIINLKTKWRQCELNSLQVFHIQHAYIYTCIYRLLSGSYNYIPTNTHKNMIYKHIYSSFNNITR